MIPVSGIRDHGSCTLHPGSGNPGHGSSTMDPGSGNPASKIRDPGVMHRRSWSWILDPGAYAACLYPQLACSCLAELAAVGLRCRFPNPSPSVRYTMVDWRVCPGSRVACPFCEVVVPGPELEKYEFKKVIAQGNLVYINKPFAAGYFRKVYVEIATNVFVHVDPWPIWEAPENMGARTILTFPRCRRCSRIHRLIREALQVGGSEDDDSPV